jgi:predicted RNase H-like HicB family nuclease
MEAEEYEKIFSYLSDGSYIIVVCMIIIIIKFPCEIIILQIYDRNKYYIIEVPDIKGTQ